MIILPLLSEKQPIACKWVFRIKYHVDGCVERHKAQLAAKGFTQVEGIDFIDTFSPVAKMVTFRLLMSFIARCNCHLFQFDVNNVFLNGALI